MTPSGRFFGDFLIGEKVTLGAEHGFAMLGTRVTFPSWGKSPKARQGLRPLESPGAESLPFSRSLRIAPGYLQPQK